MKQKRIKKQKKKCKEARVHTNSDIEVVEGEKV